MALAVNRPSSLPNRARESTLALDGLFTICSPDGLASSGDDAQKAPGEHIPQQSKEGGCGQGEHGDGSPVAFRISAEQVQWVGGRLHMNAVEQGIGHQVLEDGLGFEIKEIISPQTDQRR